MGSSSSRQRPLPQPPVQHPQQHPQHPQQQHHPHHAQQQQQPWPAGGYAPTTVYAPPPPQQQHPSAAGQYHQGYTTNGQLHGGYAAPHQQQQAHYHHHQQQPFMGGGHVLPQQQPHYGAAGHYGQPPRPLPPPPTHEYRQTQTIKNQVNLRKKTLRLEPDPAHPQRLTLSFVFDASAACRVTTFLLATEDPSQGCRIIGAVAEPRMPAYYDKGMDCRFPQNDGMAAQHAIDLSKHSSSLLTLATGNSYPLLIRLEALTEQAVAEGRTLQQLEIGGALPVWAQAQSTYAKLRAEDDGRWALQIIKQKIWVGGVSYELQEIYGMEAAARSGGVATGVPAEDVEGRECVICMSAPRDTTVLPCRHMCMCQPCAAALRTQTNKCPICREPMESLLHIKL